MSEAPARYKIGRPMNDPRLKSRRPARRAWALAAALAALGCEPSPRAEVFVRKPPVGERTHLWLSDGSPERPFDDLGRALRYALPGAVVHVGPGVYRGALRIERDVRIRGEGEPRPVIDADGAPRGVTILGVKANLQRVEVSASEAPVELRSTEGVSIRGKCDVTIQDAAVSGFRTGVRVELDEGAVAIVQDSEVRRSADYGISIAGRGEAVLSGNLVTASGVTGVAIGDRVRFKMLKNRITGSGNFGVEISPRAEGELVGNYVERSGLTGVALRTPGRIVLAGNESMENGAYGFACLAKGEFECSGNRAERNGRAGMDDPCKEACAP